MKKIFILLTVALSSLGITAQENVSNENVEVNTTKPAENPYKPYSRLYAGYSPVFISEGSYHSAGTETVHGGIVGWTYGVSLTRKCPLYLEFGFAMSLNGRHRIIVERWDDDIRGKNIKAGEMGYNYTLLRLAVPFNLTYRFSLSNNFMIAPYAGFTCCFNPINDYTSFIEYTDEYKKTDDYKIISFFFPEFEEKIYFHHEIQASCQIGFNMTVARHFSIGAEYGLDLTKLGYNTKSSRAAIKLGYEW